jgi:YspA, cpYpsA-related SLOG family
MKLLVSGYREYQDYAQFSQALNELGPSEILHGGCRGADQLASRYAEEHGLKQQIFEADWSQGRSAGPRRNQLMLDQQPDHVILFLSIHSKGTLDMLTRVQKAGIAHTIINI